MSTDAEIREWAKAEGKPVTARGKLAADVRAEYEAAHPGDPQDDGDVALVIELPPGADEADGGEYARRAAGLREIISDPALQPPPRKAETPPRGRKRRVWERATTDKKTGQRKPARVSLESLASWAWGLGGMALQQAPRSTPVGRMLAIQAPPAGVIVDDLVRGTVVDRVLQPFARGSEKAEKAFALLGPPVIVGMISSKPELYPALIGPLKVAMMSWAEIAGPAMEKAAEKARRLQERVGDGRQIDEMIAALFADLPIAEKPSADEEAAIRRARGE